MVSRAVADHAVVVVDADRTPLSSDSGLPVAGSGDLAFAGDEHGKLPNRCYDRLPVRTFVNRVEPRL